jgi:hypothetical protein
MAGRAPCYVTPPCYAAPGLRIDAGSNGRGLRRLTPRTIATGDDATGDDDDATGDDATGDDATGDDDDATGSPD